MNGCIFYPAEASPALTFAAARLREMGFTVTTTPGPSVTHLLLPVPSFDGSGRIRGGQELQELLGSLPPNIHIIGGSLDHPALQGFDITDLLQDETYVAQNAYITAHCAVRLVMDLLPVALRGCKVLVIGWGRIGKCLAALLKGLEAQVTVAARKDADRAMLRALGYEALPTEGLSGEGFRVILNTAPVMVLPEGPAEALKIELASKPGIGGEDVIRAGGLPGKYAPETSGVLIARTAVRLLDGKEKQL